MMAMPYALLLFCILSCGGVDAVVIVSADAEWRSLKKMLRPASGEYERSPYGEWFHADWNDGGLIFFHGGWGKIDAAASAQYAITRWRPRLVINLGTAGGFPGRTVKGDLVLASRTVSYDIYERMGDGAAAVAHYSTDSSCPVRGGDIGARSGVIASGDQDLLPGRVSELAHAYGAVAGDWESSAVAHVARRNGVRCCVLRGITDVVHPWGSETYGNIAAFEKNTDSVMKGLLEKLPALVRAAR